MEQLELTQFGKLFGSIPWSGTREYSVCACSVAQSYPALCNPMHCSLPRSSAHGIFQATTLGWVATSYSGDLPNPGIEPMSFVTPALAGRFFTSYPSILPPRYLCFTPSPSIQLPKKKKSMQILTTKDMHNFHKSTIFNSQKLRKFLNIHHNLIE